MPALRRDPTTDDWVVFAPERTARPHDTKRSGGAGRNHQTSTTCPFCPGNEDQTPQEVLRLSRSPSGWDVRGFRNRFPAFEPSVNPPDLPGSGFFDERPARGAHEVIVETPDHEASFASLEPAQVVRVFQAYQSRYRALRDLPCADSIIVFRNHRLQAGTSLSHPHSQLVATPLPTPLARRRYEVARAYYKDRQACLYCDLRDAERKAGARILFEEGSAVALQPFASRFPFETWVLPLEHNPSFGNASPEELRDVALATRRVLAALDAALRDPPFNYVLHTAPVAEEDQPYFLWHVQIIPRLGTDAGFELGSGMHINSSFPEETADVLRRASEA